MKVPGLYRLSKEDLKEAPSWIDKIIYSFNLLLEAFIQLLTKGLTFQDNFACDIRTLRFTTDSNYTSGTFNEINYRIPLRNKPIGVLVIKTIEEASVFTPITNAVQASWTSNGDNVTIGYLSGLDDSKTYSVTVLTF